MKKILIGLAAVIALAVTWWLAAPLFYDSNIDESLPATTGEVVYMGDDATTATDTGMDDAKTEMGDMMDDSMTEAKKEVETKTKEIKQVVEEKAPKKVAAVVEEVKKGSTKATDNIVKSAPVKTVENAVKTVKQEATKTVEANRPTVTTQETKNVVKEKAAQVEDKITQPTAVKTETKVEESQPVVEEVEMPMQTMSVEKHGMFVGADRFHKGEGQLLVVREGDKTFLRFEDFKVTNGPDLFISLNEGTSPKGKRKLVGKLKASTGNQNYDISEYDLDDFKSVSVYCRAFFVNFATAQLN